MPIALTTFGASDTLPQRSPLVVVRFQSRVHVRSLLKVDRASLHVAWKNWGTATLLKPNSIILHSRQDEVIPFADSEELVAHSGLPPKTLVEIGTDHRLADPQSLQAMLDACEQMPSADQHL